MLHLVERYVHVEDRAELALEGSGDEQAATRQLGSKRGRVDAIDEQQNDIGLRFDRNLESLLATEQSREFRRLEMILAQSLDVVLQGTQASCSEQPSLPPPPAPHLAEPERFLDLLTRAGEHRPD